MQKIVVRADKCTGCKLCMSICALYNDGVNDLKRSRIQIVKDSSRIFSNPEVCRQCGKPPCVNVCPIPATRKDPLTKVVTINPEECIDCEACVDACPFGARIPLDGEVIKCELCNGNPQCVQVCATGAIEFIDPFDANERVVNRRGARSLAALRRKFDLSGQTV